MRVVRRAPLLVALSLLVSAATANAECAWVWNNVTHRPKDQPASYAWTLRDGYESKKECDRAAAAERAAFPGQGRKVYGELMTTLDEQGTSIRVEFLKCPPAGADPRPRYRE